MAQADISIIIPVENRVEAVPTLLSCLEKQSFPAARYEVLLVFFGASAGENLVAVERYAAAAPMPVKCLREPAAATTRARNLGAYSASGAWLLFLDQDLLAGPHLLEAHFTALGANPQAVVMGAVGKSQSLPEGRLTRWFMKHDQDLMSADRPDLPFFWSSRHCSMARDALVAQGGFNELFCASRAADILLAQRLKQGRHAMTRLPGLHAFIWHEARFEVECARFWREGYDLCRLSLMQGNPEIRHYFQLTCSHMRYRADALFTPFYVRSCLEGPLDIRVHGQSCLRVFQHDRHRGARAALSSQMPMKMDMEGLLERHDLNGNETNRA